MSKRIAVAIVHGSGRQDPGFANEMTAALYKYFPRHLNASSRADAELVIEPIYWADLTHEVEEQVWRRVYDSGPMKKLNLRRFIFNLAGDTLAYQPSGGRRELYLDIHRTIAAAFQRLAERAGPDAPLCVIGHSMGTIVAHNYIYDMQHEAFESELPRPGTRLEAGETLALFVTFGSPIAIWRLRFGADYRGIRFPGAQAETLYPGIEPKWLNIYDADDVLGYPISAVTEGYQELARAGYLEDREKNVGSIFKSWNPLAHTGYLRDKRSLDDLAGYLAKLWRGAFEPAR